MEKEELMRLAFVILIGLLFLTACSTPPRVIEISAKPISKPELILPPAEQLRLKDVEWIIITEENADEIFAKLKESRKDPMLIGLSDDGYEVLGLNYSDIMSYIQQQNAIIKAYENYYVLSEEALEQANSTIEGAQQEVKEQNIVPQESVLDKLNPFK